jgi:hypothetical protein
MPFLKPTLESFQKHISKLKTDTPPKWGTMSAQRMVEHLCDWFDVATGKGENLQLEIPEDKVAKAQAFLFSEHPLPRNFKVKFLPDSLNLRQESLDTAIATFESKWKEFEAFYTANPETTVLHPNFGEMNYELLLALYSKHLTHHFEQFNLI